MSELMNECTFRTHFPAVPYAALGAALSVLDAFLSRMNLSFSFNYSGSSVGPDRFPFAALNYQWALGTHNPVAGSLVLLSWATFVRLLSLHTRNPPQNLLFWRCSNPAVQTSRFGSHQSVTDLKLIHFSSRTYCALTANPPNPPSPNRRDWNQIISVHFTPSGFNSGSWKLTFFIFLQFKQPLPSLHRLFSAKKTHTHSLFGCYLSLAVRNDAWLVVVHAEVTLRCCMSSLCGSCITVTGVGPAEAGLECAVK